MREVPRDHDHLWNDLPVEERKRLQPHMIERQILLLEQARDEIVKAHRAGLRRLDAWIANCRKSLKDETR